MTEFSGELPVFVSEILIASSNLNKILELQTVGRKFGLSLLSPGDIAQKRNLGPWPEVQETGATYQENALLKGIAFSKWAGIPALGDDSGLEVTALDNRPGVWSARYAGAGASDKDKIAKLLQDYQHSQIANKDRSAYFCCHLALCYPLGAVLFGDASLKGTLLDEPRGEKGFGYDPIILIDELGKTLAEIDFELTCEKGFRARAAEKLFSKLLSLRGGGF